MFTGIIEARAALQAVESRIGGTTIRFALGDLATGTRLGDSICCNGICLTVANLESGSASFVLSSETLRKTTAGSWRMGTVINCERALALGNRLGGHLVTGHVDAVGQLVDRRRDGDSECFTFTLPDDGSVAVVEKGSITVDGISLTSWGCRDTRFSVAVIPHTLAVTTLGSLRPGARVNLEQDCISRWVEKMVTRQS